MVWLLAGARIRKPAERAGGCVEGVEASGGLKFSENVAI